MIRNDNRGNKLEIDREGRCKLYLKREPYPRSLGNYKDGILTVRKNKEKHYHYKIKGYGFNNELLQNLPKDTEIRIKLVGSKIGYKTTIQEVLEKGVFQEYLTTGFEKQVIIPCSEMELSAF